MNYMNEKIKKIEIEKIKNQILFNFDCHLKKEAKNLVFGKGSLNAKIFFIGEAPGAKEDELEIPFVGRAGKDLDKELNKINLDLDKIYIANILKYRPPKNRNPSKTEIINHTPFLIEQIKIISPKIIIPMGNFASKFVLNNFNEKGMNKIEGISKIHGKEFKIKFNNYEFIVIPIYHPSAMIYNQKLRTEFENDFIKIKKILDEIEN